MAAAHPFGAFVRYRFKRIGCVRRIKVKCRKIKANTASIVPKGASVVRIACSFTSGGRLAIRTRLVPIAVLTIDSTPLGCLYSACPFVSLSRSCTYTLSINFM